MGGLGRVDMNADIFISFASQDRKVADILCTALESRGFGCWISSRNIQPGENFQVSIVQAIRRARIMLLVFTENSNKSEEMTKELALASQQKLIVIPLRVEDVTPNEAFSYEFATRQWIDFFADWEFAMDQLSLRIASAIGDPAADAAAAPAPAPAPPPEARIPPTEAPKTSVRPSKVSAPVEGHKKPAAMPPAATVHAPVERTKRPMAALALAGAAVAVAVAVGLMLSAPKPKAPAVEPKVAILASATLAPTLPTQPTPPAAEDPVAAADEAPKAKAAPKRKAPKVQRQVEEEIPY
ncbi:toll/interleukin-1 receptor domain-containing protein [Phenylobacterium sp. LH3H17]|uniref:toll/interleukin-1 receptor domain-containing protein n=1 Tax=Phenylobacterium sp. LH3H17 TaxID=2903901 RepID=UPI0020C974B9|nr:toll/interleukin-1 receptor domain-containing protein [Phenylobacterium sp. LH3H17]UTP38608.1 toll/interleukin-1 receptor domain-containing protein [Phenylobacterium sp. LH3H17]